MFCAENLVLKEISAAHPRRFILRYTKCLLQKNLGQDEEEDDRLLPKLIYFSEIETIKSNVAMQVFFIDH